MSDGKNQTTRNRPLSRTSANYISRASTYISSKQKVRLQKNKISPQKPHKKIWFKDLIENIKQVCKKYTPRSYKNVLRRIRVVSVALMLLLSIVLPFLPTEFAEAATATSLPDGDVTAQWGVLGGADDASCSGGTHCDRVDEDVSGTPDTSDYVATGGTGTSAASAAEEYSMQSVSNVDSASSVTVRIYAQSASNANGGTLDDINVQLRIGGSLLTATTVTPAYNTWAEHTATFNGTWSQSDVNGMQVLLTRVTQGSGNPTAQQDDVQVAAVSADVTYTQGVSLEQSAYRWLNNQDGVAGSGTEWTEATSSAGWTGRIDFVSLSFNDKLWVMGGYNGGHTNEVWSSTDGTTWTQVTASANWTARSGAAGAVFDNKMWIFGGFTAGGAVNDVWYSTDGATWTQATAGAGWAARNQHVAMAHDGKMWVAGGGGASDYNDVWHSTDGATWTQATASAGWAARTGLSSVVYDNKMWVMGGYIGTTYQRNVWYSTDGATWTQATASANWTARREQTTLVYDNKMWLLGGYDGAAKQDVWHSTDGATWTQATASANWSARSMHSSAVFKGTLWIMGGSADNGGTTRYNDVYYMQSGSVGIGSALATLSTPTTALAEGSPFRLRMNLHASIANATAGSSTMKLQYAKQGADNTCDTSFTNESYQDLSASSGVIRYYDNSIATDGAALTTSVDDPTHSGHTVTAQTYEESNNFGISNTIANGSDGMWDFALVDHSAPANTTYCFRAVYSTGTELATYSVIPEITTQSATLDQSGYRWFENQDGVQSNTLVSVWGGTGNDVAESIKQTSDGGYVVVGYTASSGLTSGGNDQSIVKYNASGVEEWSKTWGGSGNEIAYDVVQTSDGGYAVIGATTTAGVTAGGFDQTLVKYDSSGVEQWSKTWGTTDGDAPTDIIETSDGGFAVVGYSNGSISAGFADQTLVKYNSSGAEQWSKTWGGDGTDVAIAVTEDADGSIVVAGHTSTGSLSAGGKDQTLVKYNSSGAEQWSKTWGTISTDHTNDMSATADGGYVVVGYSTGNGSTNDQTIVKYDSSGMEQWSKFWDSSTDIWGGARGEDYARGVVQTPDGGYLVSGYSEDYDNGYQDLTLIKYNSSGVEQWSKTWGDPAVSALEYGHRITLTSDGGVAVVGQTDSYGSGSADQLFVKFDASGDIANCGPPNCVTHTISEIDAAISEVGHTMTEVDHTMTETDHTMTEVDRTANSVQEHIAGHVTFAKTWGGTGVDIVHDVAQTTDGGYVAVGQTDSFGPDSDIFITKYDAVGSEEWSGLWVGSANEIAYGVIQSSDGGFVLTGVSASFGAGNNDMIIAKYTSGGTLSWNTTWGGTGIDDKGWELIESSDGGFVVAGQTASFGAGNSDQALVKFNSSGQLVWDTVWGGTADDIAYSLVQSNDGGYVVTGVTASFGAGNNDMTLNKFDSEGSLLWNKTWGGTGVDDAGWDIISASGGSYIVAGQTGSFGAGNSDIAVVKFDELGSVVWNKTWGDTTIDIAYSLTSVGDSGEFIVAGVSSANGSDNDKVVIKYDKSGTVVWDKIWGSLGSGEIAYDVIHTEDSGFLVAGHTDLYGAGSDEGSILKYDDSGNIDGCSASVCMTMTATTTNPTATTTTPTATITDPTATTTTPTATSTAPTATTTIATTTAPWLALFNVPGDVLSAENSSLDNITRDGFYRLRLAQHIGQKKLLKDGIELKLQIAPKVGTCDTGFVGEQFSDVTGSSSVYFYTGNTNIADGDGISPSGADPVHNGHATILQSFETANTFTMRSDILPGKDGLWDFALGIEAQALGGGYCARVVYADGSPLDSYSHIAEINVPPMPQQQLRHGRFFSAGEESQPFGW